MSDEDQVTIATVSGKDLLDRLDSLSTNFRDFTQKLDDVPTKVADHEIRLRTIEGRHFVSWPALGVVMTSVSAGFGAVLAAVHAWRG